MGDCGCINNGKLYTLPAPNGMRYILRFLPACRSCSVGSSIVIEEETKYHVDEISQAEPLQFVDAQLLIRCGLDPDEARKQFAKVLVDTATVPEGSIDSYLADVLAEDLWNECLQDRPSLP